MENASLFQDVGTSEKRKIYAVTEITRRIKSVLENELGHIWVEGELFQCASTLIRSFVFYDERCVSADPWGYV